MRFLYQVQAVQSSEVTIFSRAPVGTFAAVTIVSNPRGDAGGEAIQAVSGHGC